VRDNPAMSLVKQEGFIDAPVERIWELIADIDRHEEWWPRMAGAEVEDTSVGSVYRQVVETPTGSEVAHFEIEGMEDYKLLNIRCLDSGMFLRFGLTEARDGTFVQGEMGMDPIGISNRFFDIVGGRRFFKTWISETFAALERAARGDGGSAP
jgi:uncharacterized protein YndB with AHSA1/START domain